MQHLYPYQMAHKWYNYRVQIHNKFHLEVGCTFLLFTALWVACAFSYAKQHTGELPGQFCHFQIIPVVLGRVYFCLPNTIYCETDIVYCSKCLIICCRIAQMMFLRWFMVHKPSQAVMTMMSLTLFYCRLVSFNSSNFNCNIRA